VNAVSQASVAPEVFALRPDYRAIVLMAQGLRGGPTEADSDAALRRAEQSVAAKLGGAPPESLPQIAAWRDAFRAFGVKPREARSSVEALVRRTGSGLPRIDRLTDMYNAVSVEHLIPLGGEDLDRYVGAPRLVCAVGDESFDTTADGEPVTVNPEVGEVVWRDDVGITCRRWNWRQCVRTRLTPETTNALFILDALAPITSDALQNAADDLDARLRALSPEADISQRMLSG
jgi:DNA/RNA-binding domain of Phe-tRNA-synthetase-like protein